MNREQRLREQREAIREAKWEAEQDIREHFYNQKCSRTKTRINPTILDAVVEKRRAIFDAADAAMHGMFGAPNWDNLWAAWANAGRRFDHAYRVKSAY